MTRVKASSRIAIVALVMLGLGACSSGSKGPAAGTVRGACYPNGTCNTGLTCFSDVCVDTRPDGGKDAAGDGAKDASPVDGGDDRAAPDDAGLETNADAAPTSDVASGDAPTGDVVDAAAGGFTPASLAGLALWLDADQGVVLGESNGRAYVASWHNQSPYDVVGTPDTTSAVVANAAIGTHAGIDLTHGGIAVGALDARTKPFLLEMLVTDIAAGTSLYDSTSTGAGLSVTCDLPDGKATATEAGLDGGAPVAASTVNGITPGPRLIGVQIDGAGNLSVRVDGVVANTQPNATGDLGETRSYFGHAIFGEIVAVVGPISANDVTALEGYLLARLSQ
jgi:hypothetical protein